jgi:DNA polymerase
MKRVFSIGPKDARLAIIGEAPGADEELIGKPFVGPAGRLLCKLLQQAQFQLNREEVFFANLALVRPPQNRFEWFYTVDGEKYLQEGLRTLYWDLQEDPERTELEATILLGARVLKHITGQRDSITKLRGTRIETLDWGTVFPTFHPSYVLHGQWAAEKFILRDLMEVNKFLLESKRKLDDY